MPVTKVTRRLLKIDSRSFNIAALVPYALPAMRLIMESTAEHYQHHFSEDNDGDTPNWELMQPQWSLQWAAVATGLPDFLRATYPGLYGEGAPVRIGTVNDYVLLEDDAEVGPAPWKAARSRRSGSTTNASGCRPARWRCGRSTGRTRRRWQWRRSTTSNSSSTLTRPNAWASRSRT